MPSRVANIKVSGHEKVLQTMEILEQSGHYIGRMRHSIQSGEPYTHWIEEGFYLSGRPGRTRARHMMAKGRKRILEILGQAISRNALAGEAVLRHSISGVMTEGTRVTKANTPVVSGNLRASMHTVNTER